LYSVITNLNTKYVKYVTFTLYIYIYFETAVRHIK